MFWTMPPSWNWIILPEHLLVLGGGYIGLEFGQMFRRFGSRVTIVQADAQLLAHEDTDIVDEITKIFREDGIEVLLNAKTQRVSGDENKITLEIQARSRAANHRGNPSSGRRRTHAKYR